VEASLFALLPDATPPAAHPPAAGRPGPGTAGGLIRLGGIREGKPFSLTATVSERPGKTRNGTARN
jgi:hypothetical protein